jgi:hypothetical protein
MAAFSGFYGSHEPPPPGDARGIVQPHRDGHQNGQQCGYILHCCFVDCRPGGRQGRYGASSYPMAAPSGFGVASDDVTCFASTRPHDHRNGM